MERELISNLRAVFDAFSARSNLAPSTIWMRAAKDARFMSRVEAGAAFTVKTYDSIIGWFSRHWPDGAEWPAKVDRPAAGAGEA